MKNIYMISTTKIANPSHAKNGAGTIMQEAFFTEYADKTPFDWTLDVS